MEAVIITLMALFVIFMLASDDDNYPSSMCGLGPWAAVARLVKAAVGQSKGELGHVVILYQRDFPLMTNRDFRDRVLKIMETNTVLERAQFSPPDEYDDWTFVAYRRKGE